jgi:selenocysteine lyase/cysteine desulfurase
LQQVPIVTFRITRRPTAQVVEWFQTRMGIRVRPMAELGLNAVRASFHLVNRVADVDWFADGVRVLAA